jgi:hypothetical protein
MRMIGSGKKERYGVGEKYKGRAFLRHPDIVRVRRNFGFFFFGF